MSYEDVKREIRERILDSYHNGQKAAGNPLPSAPPRRRVVDALPTSKVIRCWWHNERNA